MFIPLTKYLLFAIISSLSPYTLLFFVHTVSILLSLLSVFYRDLITFFLSFPQFELFSHFFYLLSRYFLFFCALIIIISHSFSAISSISPLIFSPFILYNDAPNVTSFIHSTFRIFSSCSFLSLIIYIRSTRFLFHSSFTAMISTSPMHSQIFCFLPRFH